MVTAARRRVGLAGLLGAAVLTMGASAQTPPFETPPSETAPIETVDPPAPPVDDRRALVDAARAGDADAAEALLPGLFARTSTPQTRAVLFADAARAAAGGGDFDLAYAYADWGLEAALASGDQDLARTAGADAVRLAAAQGDRRQALIFARTAAAASDARDEPDARRVRFEATPLVCPDALAWFHARAEATLAPGAVDVLRAATCRYAALPDAPAQDLTVRAVRSSARPRELLRAFLTGTLDLLPPPRDEPAGLRVLETVPALQNSGRDVRGGAVFFARPGTDLARVEVLAIAVDGERLTLAAGRTRAREWPPAALEAVVAEALSVARVAEPEDR